MSPSTTSLLIAAIALGISLFSLLWQVFTWRQGRLSDVAVEIEGPASMTVGVGKYEIEVVVRNRGSAAEGVEAIALEFPVIEDKLFTMGGVCVWQRKVGDPEVAPRRSLRKAFDLVDLSRFSAFPASMIAHVTLESGRTVASQPYLPSKRLLEVSMAGLETTRDLTADLPDGY